ncbi:Malonyl CoA-acyl carrier protein transacylase [Candidatus Fokinia solitaria]|uniref:Malonyl CoA-acyl carrier protein transacylase n=1 Tax=Candidatus Fokinia solitaria TaxID=1802984 RepID=A0A2U8BRF4_9RICK|nr:ACP S-malonyltransferase [Candidatus Fokinia solitaria]AWD32917.1 Malonyl CoA-acyl carrier protein transacylase [Candidatus Fokinia solitaria]
MAQDIVLLFPGQGSQYVKMGQDLYEEFSVAREVFEEVDDALEMKLTDVIFGDDIELLTTTYNAQPAIMAVSMAVVRILQKEMKKKFYSRIKVVAGHSLGEYSALCAANGLSIRNTAKLLFERGKIMYDAAASSAGGMFALLGCYDIAAIKEMIASVKKCCEDDSICEVANDNGAGQVILSCTGDALVKLPVFALERGIRKVIKLNVNMPFHSSIMKEAASCFTKYLNVIDIKDTDIPIVTNYDAKAHVVAREIKEVIALQMNNLVRWKESIEYILQSCNPHCFVEVGPKRVLSDLATRMLPDEANIKVFSTSTLEEISDFLNIT